MGMIGYQIYIIFRRDMVKNRDVMETPHATFDGTYEHMRRIAEHFSKEKGFEVKHMPYGSFYVFGPQGFKRMYYVVTRTIEK